MQTVNRYAPDFCGCVEHGQLSPHTDGSQCEANRQATVEMQNRNTSASIASAYCWRRFARRPTRHSLSAMPRMPALSDEQRFLSSQRWYVWASHRSRNPSVIRPFRRRPLTDRAARPETRDH